jgi:hypothetical protein
MDTFEIERALDLPGPLPQGEEILWMDSPDWKRFAMRVFHLKALAAYFALVLAAHSTWLLMEGHDRAAVLASTMRLLPLAIGAIGAFLVLGWLMAKSTVYAVTNHRVFLRIGVALSITVTVPFKTIRSADIRIFGDGTGDIPLSTLGGDHIAMLHLWPHAMPWQLKNTVPMLRSVPEAARVADILGAALRADLGRSHVAPASAETSKGFAIDDGALSAAD